MGGSASVIPQATRGDKDGNDVGGPSSIVFCASGIYSINFPVASASEHDAGCANILSDQTPKYWVALPPSVRAQVYFPRTAEGPAWSARGSEFRRTHTASEFPSKNLDTSIFYASSSNPLKSHPGGTSRSG